MVSVVDHHFPSGDRLRSSHPIEDRGEQERDDEHEIKRASTECLRRR